MKRAKIRSLMKIVDKTAIPAELDRRENSSSEMTKLDEDVKKIVEEVKKRGDAALIEFTRKFDNVSLREEDLKVKQREIEDAYRNVGEKEVSTIKAMKERIESLEGRILEKMTTEVQINGIKVKFRIDPIESVGCYVPGGIAAYPSTLVMTTTPAKLAGVPRVVVCSPPRTNGSVNPLTLVAADVCGVDEFYKVGGAQAIAAMAYGTETIKSVLKIVGPGNKYVAAVKRLISKDVAIDMPAGPSELLILADDSADPRLIALDLCSQAEHGPDSIVGLVTTSKGLVLRVLKELSEIVEEIPRKEIVIKALRDKGFILLCDNINEMIEFANRFAPEHVEVMTDHAENIADMIRNAGLVLVGPYSPAALSDYYCGTNHVLPTGGFGKMFSGLSVLDFVRKVAIVSCSREGIQGALGIVKILAEAEGLPNHYRALEGRLKVEN